MKRSEIRAGMRVVIVKKHPLTDEVIGKTGTVIGASGRAKLLVDVELDAATPTGAFRQLAFYPGELESSDPIARLGSLA